MAHYARLEDNVAMELLDLDDNIHIDGLFSPEMVWVIAPLNVEVGWVYNPVTESFSAPPPPVLTPEQLLALAKSTAYDRLARNDRVLVRCLKAGVPYPAAWAVTDEPLRNIVRAAEWSPSLVIPPQPDYPAGT